MPAVYSRPDLPDGILKENCPNTYGQNSLFAEVEYSRTSLASGTSSRTHFDVLGLKGQVLGLGLEASSPRKLPCPRLEDSTIF